MTGRLKPKVGPATGQIRPLALPWSELTEDEITGLSATADWDVAADRTVLAVISDIIRSLVASEIASELLPRSRPVSKALQHAAERLDFGELREFRSLDMPDGVTSGDPNFQASILSRRGPALDGRADIEAARNHLRDQAAALEALATNSKRASRFPVDAMRCFSWPFRMSNPEESYSLPSKPGDCAEKPWPFALFASELLRLAAVRVPAAAEAAGVPLPIRLRNAAGDSLQRPGVPAWTFVRELQKADAKNCWPKSRRTQRPISVV